MTQEQNQGSPSRLLPQSSVLAEAEVDSIAHLMSQDPEHLTPEDRGRIIAALRAQRLKWEAAEKAEAGKPKRVAKAVLATSTIAKAEDLGL